jgi:hypothetical protein
MSTKINASVAKGVTPLHKAAEKNNIPMIKMLASHGADLRAANRYRETPLDYSIIYGGSDLSCKLHTMKVLLSLEAKHGGKIDWVHIKKVANRSYIREKRQINAFVDKMKKNSSSLGKDSDIVIGAIIDKMPRSQKERLNSCDAKTALAAAEEIIDNPATLKEPLDLFAPAFTYFMHGKKDKAVFWFYAAQLRVEYQLAFQNGDRGQLLKGMRMLVGPPILNYAYQDISNLGSILDRVLEWDKKTPNPYREKPRTSDINNKIEHMYKTWQDYKAKLVKDKKSLEKEARKAAPGIEHRYLQVRNRCNEEKKTL